MALLECTATQLHSGPEIEWGDDADDCDVGDGHDDIGPPCALLTSLSDGDQEWNNNVKPRLIILFTRFSLKPPPLFPFFNQVMKPRLRSKGREEIDGERITVKRID